MDALYEENLRLGQYEYAQQRTFLRSWPRCLGLVLGNTCNIYCPHCYQEKNGDNLLKPAEIGRELRREFMAMYPYLATLRIQGGEALAYAGFREMLDDVAATVQRPIVSISTNGTLLDERWAERMVRLPFATVTVSIDGAARSTYARLRQGADLDAVLANVRRLQRWKEKLSSPLPHLDSFFVVMRSNFREIPRYLDLMHEYGFSHVALQTMELNSHNMSREPTLAREERISEPEEIRELFDIMRAAAPAARQCFRRLSTSGLTSLFESQGLDSSFLREETDGLYPNSEDLKPQEDGVPLCPNPWTTLFVAENGDVHLCFLSEPVGNLYEEPLAAIWNCPHALIKRSRMILGRYEESGCSAHWCSWREGKKAPPGPSEELQALREEMDELARRAAQMQPLVQIDEAAPAISAVRRKLAARNGRIQELEAMFVQLCAANGAIHKKGQRYIDQLEQRIKILEARIVDLQEQEIRHANDWRQLESETARVTAENERLRRLPAVRLAHRLARMVSWRRN